LKLKLADYRTTGNPLSTQISTAKLKCACVICMRT
jgi:hypothetical protein